MIEIADNLTGSLSQLIDRCRSRIEGWISSIAEGYLPLSGGHLSGDLSSDGSVTSNSVVTDSISVNNSDDTPTKSTLSNGVLVLKKAGDNSADLIMRLATSADPGTNSDAPSQQRWSGMYIRGVSGKDAGKFFTMVNTNKKVESVMCVHEYNNPNNHYHISINHDPINGAWSHIDVAPKDSLQGYSSFVDSQIATAKWVKDTIASNINTTISNISSNNGLVLSATGASNKPIYINASGIPTACGFEVNKSVPADAKFTDTDTIYTHPTAIYLNTDTAGNPKNNTTPSWGQTVTISQVYYNSEGHVTKLQDRTIKIPESTATTTSKGLMSSTDKSSLEDLKTNGATKDYVQTLVNNPSGGLVLENGKLKVDFSKMPDTTAEDQAAQEAFKESILAGLDMQIPLRNNSKVFYVDCNSDSDKSTINVNGNTVTVDRGSRQYPYKTIQACITHVTEDFSFGTHSINIYIAPGVYTENVTLPDFNRTSGRIYIRALDYADPPIIKNNGLRSTPLSITGGTWSLYRIIVEAVHGLTWSWQYDDNGDIAVDSGGNQIKVWNYRNVKTSTNAVNMTGANTSCTFYGCEISEEYLEDAPRNGRSFETITLDVLSATVNFSHYWDNTTKTLYLSKLSLKKRNSTTSTLIRLRGHSTFYFGGYDYFYSYTEEELDDNGNPVTVTKYYPTSAVDTIEFNGDNTDRTIIKMDEGSLLRFLSGDNYTARVSGNITGKPYSISGGSILRWKGPLPGEFSSTTEQENAVKEYSIVTF